MAKKADKAQQINSAECESGEQYQTVGLIWKETIGWPFLF
jgi:hypothetical protein